MLAFDCVLETHENAHFTAENDQSLIERIRQHCHQYHPELSDAEIREMFDAGAYDPEARATTVRTLARVAGSTVPLSSSVEDTVGDGRTPSVIELADLPRPLV